MDLDIEMDEAVDEFAPQTVLADPEDGDSRSIGPQSMDDEDGEIQETPVLVPNKIHVRGLDVFNEAQLKAYVSENYSGAMERIEWIDDTSANLVFWSESSAQDALIALSAVEISDASELTLMECLPAKPFTSKPEITLQLRFAVSSDKKQAGAAARSRFYLLNPDYDPEERRRGDGYGRSRYRNRDGHRSGGYSGFRNMRRYDDEDQIEQFEADMYDDDEKTLANRAGSRGDDGKPPTPQSSSDNDRSKAARNSQKELFPELKKRQGRRDRSASPIRDRDDDLGLDEARNSPQAASANRLSARGIRSRLSEANSSKELFPDKASSTRRSRLGDEGAIDEAADRIANGIRIQGIAPKEGGGEGESVTRGDASPRKGVFNIRGVASPRGHEKGFSIKGLAAGNTVKELFPNRLGSNSGRELFAEKLEGRGRRRQRAEDLFD